MCSAGLNPDVRSDRGLHYGHGVFETLLVQNGRCVLLQRHLRRLKHGCDTLGIVLPEAFEAEFKEYLAALETDPVRVVKLIVTAGVSERGYTQPESLQPHIYRFCYPMPPGCYLSPLLTAPAQLSAVRCSIRLSSQPRLSGIKHLNRLEWVLAANEVSASDADEGLLFDAQERLIESTSSNLFLVTENGQLITPSVAQSGVAGVVRQSLLDASSEHGTPIKVAEVTQTDLLRSQEVFICNSVRGIQAITGYTGFDTRYMDTHDLTHDTRTHDTRVSKTWPLGPITQSLFRFLRAQWSSV